MLKKNKNIITFIILLSVIIVNITALIPETIAMAYSKYFDFVEKSMNIMVDETNFVEVNFINDSTYNENNLTWKSSNEDIVVVDDTGVITGKSEGWCEIKATLPDDSFQVIRVDVKGYVDSSKDPNNNIDESDDTINEYDTIPFESLDISSSVTVYVNEVAPIDISYKPFNADEETITWRSSNEKVATVHDGFIKGIKTGSAEIIAVTPNDIFAICKVTVKKPQIKIEKTEVKLKVGKRYSIKATAYPDNEIIYKSQNKNIASVTSKGLVKAKSKGKTVIVIKANNISRKVKVIVK